MAPMPLPTLSRRCPNHTPMRPAPQCCTCKAAVSGRDARRQARPRIRFSQPDGHRICRYALDPKTEFPGVCHAPSASSPCTAGPGLAHADRGLRLLPLQRPRPRRGADRHGQQHLAPDAAVRIRRRGGRRWLQRPRRLLGRPVCDTRLGHRSEWRADLFLVHQRLQPGRRRSQGRAGGISRHRRWGKGAAPGRSRRCRARRRRLCASPRPERWRRLHTARFCDSRARG